jgi:hypothetical protein
MTTPASSPATAAPDSSSPAAPTATPLGALPGVPFCGRTDIATAVSSSAATGGELLATITLGNRSDAPCQISRYPDVDLLDVHNDPLPITVTLGPPCPATPFCILQEPALLLPGLGNPEPDATLQAGQTGLTLSWRAHDGSGVCPEPPPKATSVRLQLHDIEEAVVVDANSALPGGIVACDGALRIVSYGPGATE